VTADPGASPDNVGGDSAADGSRESANGRPRSDRGDRPDRGDRTDRGGRGRRGRRQRGRGRDRERGPRSGSDRGDRGDRGSPNGNDEWRDAASNPPVILVVDGETSGWFDPSRDAGFVRRAEFSYLNEQGDAYMPPQLCRQYGLRRGDAIDARTGRDSRGRLAVAEIVAVNGADPVETPRRTDFQTLTASYPERKLTLETGRPAKGGPELTRRAIDLIAPIGYGQRALIVAAARARTTMVLEAVPEGVAG
jgi:transcription termination factor Rho